MTLTKLLTIIGICFTSSICAQDLTICVNDKGKVGFTDKNGNEVVKCIYDNAQPFRNGVSIVSKSEKYGIINTSGDVLLPLKYSGITKWNDELYLVKDGKKVGLVDQSGKLVLDPIYSNISKPNCYGKALISVGGKATVNEKKTYMFGAKYGIIDNHGRMIITPTYNGFYEFSYDGASSAVYTEGKRLNFSFHYTTDTLVTDCSYIGFNKTPWNIIKAGIMDSEGKELVPMKQYDFVMQPENGMARYYNVSKKQVVCGYHNINANKGFIATTIKGSIDTLKMWTHGDFHGDLAQVRIGGAWSLIDKNGQALRTGYSQVQHSAIANVWCGKNANGVYDVFDGQNTDIPTLSGYKDIKLSTVSNDMEVYVVQKDLLYGAVNRSGETMVPFEYDAASACIHNVIPVMKTGKWGLVSIKNEPIIPMEYAGVVLPQESNAMDYWVMKSDSLYYHYNVEKRSVSGNAYKLVTNFTNGVAFVAPQNQVVEDTPINRAQCFVPNTAKNIITALDWKQVLGAFGILVKSDDTVLIDKPVSTLYKDAVLKKINELGCRKLTESETKDVLLEVTRGNRSYDLKSTIGEEEWNY